MNDLKSQFESILSNGATVAKPKPSAESTQASGPTTMTPSTPGNSVFWRIGIVTAIILTLLLVGYMTSTRPPPARLPNDDDDDASDSRHTQRLREANARQGRNASSKHVRTVSRDDPLFQRFSDT